MFVTVTYTIIRIFLISIILLNEILTCDGRQSSYVWNDVHPRKQNTTLQYPVAGCLHLVRKQDSNLWIMLNIIQQFKRQNVG